jgi:DNA repair photolyase
MNYWDMRREAALLMPRIGQLESLDPRGRTKRANEKGRKTGFHQFTLTKGEWVKRERLMPTTQMGAFLEISLRAAACPMPLNLDVWDGLLCPYGCRYCYADLFRASLYSSFFDNVNQMGLRHCAPDHYEKELLKLFDRFRGQDPDRATSEISKSVALEIPMRLGIRFEDFSRAEEKAGVSLQLLRFLAKHNYPTMINTKSALLGREDYLRALTDNEGGSAVHVTLISSDDILLKRIEPGAPGFRPRVDSMKKISEAGVRVVARIEPYMLFLTDSKDDVAYYMEEVWNAGVRNITFDTYSHSANNRGIRAAYLKQGYDFDRMFALGCDCQPYGSLLLGKFMDEFRRYGFSCSTFDLGNIPSNDQSICCEVEDCFKAGFNWGSTVGASRFITSMLVNQPTVSWAEYEEWVVERGGFLSDRLRQHIYFMWNMGGNPAYNLNWIPGIRPVGTDHRGIVWGYESKDFREEYRIDPIL